MAWKNYGARRLTELVGGYGVKAALARAAAVDGGQVTRWTTGENQPSADQLELICRHLRVSADLFLGLDEQPKSDDEIMDRLEVTLRQTETYTKLLRERRGRQ
jgi:transcriptional regulator with XRE-family HTH domain